MPPEPGWRRSLWPWGDWVNLGLLVGLYLLALWLSWRWATS